MALGGLGEIGELEDTPANRKKKTKSKTKVGSIGVLVEVGITTGKVAGSPNATRHRKEPTGLGNSQAQGWYTDLRGTGKTNHF